MGALRFFLIGMICMFSSELVCGQENIAQPVSLAYCGNGGYSLVERTDLRRYVNGKYAGLTSRELRSFISPANAPEIRFTQEGNPLKNGQWYDGSFYVMEKTQRNNVNTATGIHDTIPALFHISTDGKLTMYQDNGYPSFRSFPAFTTEKVKSGDSWKAKAERAVDPLNKGTVTRIPMLVLYTFEGAEYYNNQPVYRIKAIWQTNYNANNRDPNGDATLTKALGGHKANILVLQKTGEAILVSDQVDETFFYTDNTELNFKGTITMFTEFPPAVEHDKLLPALKRIASVNVAAGNSSPRQNVEGKGSAKISGSAESANSGKTKKNSSAVQNADSTKLATTAQKNNMVVEQTPAGLRLSLRDIRFKPNSDEILPEEYKRLDEIAAVLALAPQSQFLIEGHTARIGDISEEQPLSQKRAHRIAQELENRGINKNAFLCRGWGGTKPIASNDTEEGRAQNRRVEITILE
ncbi:MAG: OmpA family protein [Treponema sp.]|nr:OmpA family protein [Treponema sp.]